MQLDAFVTAERLDTGVDGPCDRDDWYHGRDGGVEWYARQKALAAC